MARHFEEYSGTSSTNMPKEMFKKEHDIIEKGKDQTVAKYDTSLSSTMSLSKLLAH